MDPDFYDPINELHILSCLSQYIIFLLQQNENFFFLECAHILSLSTFCRYDTQKI